MRFCLIPLICVPLFYACSEVAPREDRPERDPMEPMSEPLTFTAPEDGALYDLLDHPVAPYVLARGAGPSRLSPDGQTVATRLSLTGTRQLYVMPSDGSEEPMQLSSGSGITFFEFSPTGALIYGADNNGDEREAYWMVEPDGDGWSEPRIVLPAAENGFRSFGNFTGDGKTIVYSSTERNGLDYDIYTANIETGETALVFEGEYANFVEAVSPDGSTTIISERVGEDSDRIFVLDMESGERRVLSDPTPRANHTSAGIKFISDDEILLSTNRDTEYSRAVVLNIDDPVFSPATASYSDVEIVSSCGGKRAVVQNVGGFSDLLIGSSDPTRIALPDGVYSIDCSNDQLLVRVSAPDIPGDLYMVDLTTLKPTRTFESTLEGLDPNSLISPEPVSLTARDGVQIHGLLYLPDGVETPPVVFDVHGGPTAQSRPDWDGAVQYLLSRGIAVFQSNVRGSTGYGRTYVTLDDQDKRLDSVRDLVDMLAWLEADGRVDTSRAAVMGGSYGGYMVNAVLADYPDAFDAGVALFGVGDWVTALEVASPALKASDRIEYGDISNPEWREFYTEISPIGKADQINVPVLYSHGAMDPRIDVAETEVMVRALRENGIRADYIRFPDEGHGWRKLSNRLFYHKAQADFLEEVVK